MSEKKFIKLLFCLCCLSATAFAQKQKKVSVEQINIYAEDSFTRKALPAFVTLMKRDSTVIDTVIRSAPMNSERGIRPIRLCSAQREPIVSE